MLKQLRKLRVLHYRITLPTTTQDPVQALPVDQHAMAWKMHGQMDSQLALDIPLHAFISDFRSRLPELYAHHPLPFSRTDVLSYRLSLQCAYRVMVSILSS